METRTIFSAIIPNYNGEDLLTRCLSSLTLSCQRYGKPYEIIVVDDASTDGSCKLVQQRFPHVTLLQNSQNQGFGETVNRGAEAGTGEFLLLLNNDMVVSENFVSQLLTPLEQDKTVFGTTGKSINWQTGEPDHVSMTAAWSRGDLQLQWSDPSELKETIFLLGGACAVRRQLFVAWGGLCSAFAPFYWEDYDLSYLALKAGYKNMYQPHAVAYHFAKASLAPLLGEQGIEALRLRNRLVFIWINITDARLLISHFLNLAPQTARRALRGELGHLKAQLAALPRLPLIIKERLKRRRLVRRGDREILGRQ